MSISPGTNALSPRTSRHNKSYARIPQVLDVPNLIQSQIQSYDWFKDDGLTEVFREISPISDYTERKYELHFHDHEFRAPKYPPVECKEREITFSQPLYVKTRLVMKETGEIKEQEIFMGDIPMMTDNGTFIINGAERVVVSQLVRSPGVYFVYEKNIPTNRSLCFAKLIPSRGAWLEFETSTKDILSVKVDREAEGVGDGVPAGPRHRHRRGDAGPVQGRGHRPGPSLHPVDAGTGPGPGAAGVELPGRRSEDDVGLAAELGTAGRHGL